MRIGLQLKLTLLIAAVVALATGTVVALYVQDSRAILEDQFQKRGGAVARNLALSARLGVLSEDRGALGDLAAATLAEPDVIFVVVAAPDGTPLARTPRAPRRVPPLGEDTVAGDPPRLRVEERGNGARVLIATSGVFVDQAATALGAEDAFFAMEDTGGSGSTHLEGLVQVGLSFTDTDRRIAEAQQRSLLVAGLVALFGIVLAGVAARVATRRIDEVIRVSQKMARGELGERLPERGRLGRDETDDLAAHFNVMADAIARQRDAITAANEQLKLRNAEVEKASSMKSSFLATMSHELRTPLNAIIGFTRMVLKKSGADLPVKQRENLQKVESSAVGLLAIINDILDLSKVEAGRMSVTAEGVDPAALAWDVAGALKPLAQAKSLPLEVIVEEDVPRTTTDSTRVRQILVNLVSNAIKFTSQGAVTIRVAHDKQGNEIVLSVRDTGIGIAPEQLERVFDPFHQVDGGTTRAAGGTGLGLAIVREMTKLLGGTVNVQSKVGEGSVFLVRLPYVPAIDPPAATAESETSVDDGI